MGYGSDISLKFFLYDVVCCRDSVVGVAWIDRVRNFFIGDGDSIYSNWIEGLI